MSALSLGIDPSVYLAGVPLPPYARADLAFVITVPMTTFPNTPTTFYTVTGDYTEIPVGVSGLYNTNGTVANRVVKLLLFPPSGPAKLWQIPSPTVQAASLSQHYFWTPSTSNAYTQGTVTVMPLPNLPLTAGDLIQFTAENSNAGDTSEQCQVTVVRVPTGPRSDGGPTLTVVPTPLIA